MRQVLTFLLALVSLLGLCWLVVGALVAPVVPGGWATVAAAAVAGSFAPLAIFILLRASGLYPGRWMRLLVLRPFWYVQLALLVGALAGGVGTALGLLAGEPAAGGRILGGSALTAFAAAALLGYADSRRLRVRRIEVRSPRFPPALDGLRIVQLSDLHVGPHTPAGFLRRVAAATREAEPHLVVVTGDLVDDFPRDVDVYARYFGSLAAPLGVFASPGNHDVYAGWPAVREALARLPLTVLVNEARVLEWQGARFALVATGDPAGGMRTADGGVDLGATLASMPDGMPVIALAHNPALWPPLARAGVALTLSGHTHWGQLALPGRGWSLASVFLAHGMGAHEEDGALLWIHPGTNYWGIPFRLGTPPEVAVLTLRHAPEAALDGAPRERRRGAARSAAAVGSRAGARSSGRSPSAPGEG